MDMNWFTQIQALDDDPEPLIEIIASVKTCLNRFKTKVRDSESYRPTNLDMAEEVARIRSAISAP